MKTIIILMLALICQFANGQPIMTINEHGTLDSTVFKPREKRAYVLTNENLILLYDKYSKECYADSTLLKHQHFLPEGEKYCIVDWECLNPDHYRDYYTHIIPTFSGFMEWLKTQSK